MVNLTEMWQQAGKPDGRRPSNFKATAMVKRKLATMADPAEAWYTVGRGVKAETYATALLSIHYEAYLVTPKRGSTKATSTGATTSASTSTSTGGYTAEDMKRAYESGKMDGWDEGCEHGMANGYKYGYERGVREGSKGKLDDVHAYVNDHARGRKAFAHRFHPDRHGSTPQANANMAFINNFFDDLEKIFNRAA